MHSLLLVEDDPRLSQFLAEVLPAQGFQPLVAGDLEEAEASLVQESADFRCVILDRMVKGREGGELIPKIKKRFPDAGILILSSIDLPSEKARWLEVGADDYMGKPFSIEELVARLRKLAQPRKAGPSQLTFSDLVIDPLTQRVLAHGKPLTLTRKEFLLLSMLTMEPGRVYNRYQILDRVWQIDSPVETNVVEVTIRNLRLKLGEVASSARIESKRNVGYWIEA